MANLTKEAKIQAVELLLRRYYNDFLGIYAEEQTGGIDHETAMDVLKDIDRQYAVEIVDTFEKRGKILTL